MYTAASGKWKEILMAQILVESKQFHGVCMINQGDRRMDVKTEQQSFK